MNMSELLVVDKSIFHSLCDCDEKLCEFVTKYNVVLPHTMAIECVISENRSDKEPDKLFRGLAKAIKAGANLGYESPELLKAEKTTLCPVKSIIDEANTQKFRNFTPEINEDSIKQAANHCRYVTEHKISGLLGHARTLYENICKNQDFKNKFGEPTERQRRFEKWIQCIDQNNFMKKAVDTSFGKQISSHADANWYTWQYTRLWFAYCWEWSHKKSLPGSSEKKDISNDFYDLEYVLYLSRADGLLTNDQKLQVPLAKAAFPKKEVFVVDTSVDTPKDVQHVLDDIIDIIPESYRIE